MAVSLVTGLPPGIVLHADNLEDVPPPEGHGRVRAGDGRILAGLVVEERSDEQLRRANSDRKENVPRVASFRLPATTPPVS